jgi:diadenosine tetraphosphate (Ap4A) HIT family hydrolase
MADIEARECPFCKVGRPILESELAYAIYDLSPVTPGHMLLIPRRHIPDWFETTSEERHALLDLAQRARDLLWRERQPDGFNLGVNVGEAAGQTVGHVHLHLIPRYRGDVANPRGGVRGVIPTRQNY